MDFLSPRPPGFVEILQGREADDSGLAEIALRREVIRGSVPPRPYAFHLTHIWRAFGIIQETG